MTDLDRLLSENRVLVCAGSGGVGKTTVSAALGVRAAQIGRRTLVLTVDPARRLATALGLDLGDDRPRPVPGRNYKAQLSAAVIDSKKTFDEFIAKHAANPEAAQRILRNRLYQQMSTTLSGSQEFTSLECLLAAVESGTYDLVILDTPPTKHAMDFLAAPARINSLFQDSITKWFMGGGEKSSGFISNLVNKGTRTVIKSLEVLTGSQFIDELFDFFASVRSVQSVLRERSLSVQRLLMSDETKFVVVTSFDAAKLEEARYLQGQLKKLGYQLAAVVINRAFPIWLPETLGTRGDVADQPFAEIQGFFQEFKAYYAARYGLYDEFTRGLPKKVHVFRIPEYNQDIHGMEDLEALAAKLNQSGSAAGAGAKDRPAENHG